jgi:wyosine [tRNA(Phe)-imidazoG37] synthetase (radical SAM superfamily)
MKYVFGPVPSRRLGRSLGVDLVPFKTCSYDCIYCQLGETTRKTAERREWVPAAAVLDEIRERIASEPDWITLSGSGEPTLASRIGDLIEGIRAFTDIPVAVLTNGSLLWQPELRRELALADLIIPSLDAGDATLFEAVNRPHESLDFEEMAEGLVLLGESFQGKIWLEICLLAGYTANPAEAEKISVMARRIGPDRVQLNTVTRPPAAPFALPAEKQKLEALTDLFEPEAEIIADFQQVHQRKDFAAARDRVLQLIGRRPCSADDTAAGLGIHRNEAIKHLEELLSEGRIETVRVDERFYYRTSPDASQTGSATS